MRSGKRLLLAHEMLGLGQEARHAVEFSTFFADGQTPRTLVAAGIYSSIAVPLKGGPWRATSMALLAKAVGLHDRFRLSLPLEWACGLGRQARVDEVEGGGGVDTLHSRGGTAVERDSAATRRAQQPSVRSPAASSRWGGSWRAWWPGSARESMLASNRSGGRRSSRDGLQEVQVTNEQL